MSIWFGFRFLSFISLPGTGPLGFWFLVLGFWSVVLGFWFLVLGLWFAVLGFLCFWFCGFRCFQTRIRLAKGRGPQGTDSRMVGCKLCVFAASPHDSHTREHFVMQPRSRGTCGHGVACVVGGVAACHCGSSESNS
jgi:hypothetical protein